MVETYQQNMRELDNDLRGNSTAGNEEQKYEILYQKEKEINEFTEKFEVEKKQLENEISDDQLHIASLLEHMQKTMARQNKLPTQQMVEEMKNDLKFKQGQLEDSETTAARLRVQKEQIKADLDKVKSLEERIVNELKSAEQKITSMEDDMKENLLIIT